jgi:hypothetical protein
MPTSHPNESPVALASPNRIAARDWQASVAVAMLLAVSLLLVYLPGLGAPFIYDDHDAIIANTTLTGRFVDALKPPDQSPVTSRPLVNLSFALLHPGAPRSEPMHHHVVNLILHGLTGLTLFALARHLLRSSAFSDHVRENATLLGAVAAIVWALHPLQTETVQYITQRTELMFGLFCLATIWASARGMASSGRRQIVWFLAATTLCASGMASKEVMVVTPLLVLLVDRTLFARSFQRACRQHALLYVGLSLTWALLTWLVTTGSRSDSVGTMHDVSRVDYLLTQSAVITHYLKLYFWPDHLSISYGWPLVHSLAEVWWQFALHVVLCLLTVHALWKRPVAGLLGAWFYLLLAPTSSVLPILTEVAAERRMYMPSAALTVALIAMLYLAILSRLKRQPAIIALGSIALVICLALAARSTTRVRDYETVESIWRSAVAVAPTDDVARVGLGWELMSQGRIGDAIAPLREAVALRPDNARAQRLLGMCLFDRGDRASGIDHLLVAVRLQPNDPLARGVAIDALRMVGRYDLAEHLASGGLP